MGFEKEKVIICSLYYMLENDERMTIERLRDELGDKFDDFSVIMDELFYNEDIDYTKVILRLIKEYVEIIHKKQ